MIRVRSFYTFMNEKERYTPEIYEDDMEVCDYTLFSESVAELLNISYDKYKELLIKFNAIFDFFGSQDYYFTTYKECEIFIKSDELLYLRNNPIVKFGKTRTINIIDENI